jgi:hypothetical protein
MFPMLLLTLGLVDGVVYIYGRRGVLVNVVTVTVAVQCRDVFKLRLVDWCV